MGPDRVGLLVIYMEVSLLEKNSFIYKIRIRCRISDANLPRNNPLMKKNKKAPPRFELGISCLLDRRFNQLSHGASWQLGPPDHV